MTVSSYIYEMIKKYIKAIKKYETRLWKNTDVPLASEGCSV